MQKDSPGNQKKGRNERYSGAAQPHMLPVPSTKRRVAESAANAKDEKLKNTRTVLKQNILLELNSHSTIKARGMKPKEGKTGGQQDGSQSKHTRLRKLKMDKDKAQRQEKKLQEYTWNRNGRQTELGIRCVARKFLLLWIRNVYGRVHPYVVRNHYNNYLKKKVLVVWQEIWWSGRKGWKLNIRAEYHNRYRCWRKVIRIWKIYVNMMRAEKAKEKLAIQHASITSQGRYFKVWTKYITTRRLKTHKNDIAQKMATTSMRRWVWMQWKNLIETKAEQAGMELTALQYWASTLMANCWSSWSLALSLHLKDKARLDSAQDIAKRTLMLKVWQAWKSYRNTCRMKKIQKRVADRQYIATLATRVLKIWHARWQRCIKLSQFVDLIACMGTISRARRVIIHWKFYVALQRANYAKQVTAAAHYQTCIKRKVFCALRFRSGLRRLKDTRKMTSTNFLHKMQLKRVWNIWLERCENSEELRTYPSTRRARGYYRIKLLQKSVSHWRAYWRWRRHRKQQIHIAHTHYTLHALPRYFKRMQIFVQIMKVKQENKEAADQFRREVLFAKTFFKWHDNYQLTLDRQLMNRMAILHCDGSVKSCYFALWRQRTRQERRQHRLQAKADDHRTYCLLSTAFYEWRDFITGRKMSCYYFHAAVRHHRLRSLAMIWLAWSQYVQHKQVKWRKQATADLHYQQRVTGKLLGAWKLYFVRSREATAIASQRSTAHLKERLWISFSAWCRYTVRHRNSRLSNRRARTMYTRTMLRKVLLLWRQHAVLSAVTAEQTSVIVQEKRAILDQGKKRHALLSWINFTHSSLHDKSQLIKSYKHHRNKSLQKSLSTWQTFVRSRFRIKIHKRQSMWYHNRRIICTYFRAWKQQAFYVLLQYAISKKNKEVRIAQALEQRRSRLLENSVSQWIKVAFDLSTERNRNAQARYIRQVDSVHQYVYKCAVHWRRWTAKRKSIKAQQLHHSPSIGTESTIYSSVAEPPTRNYPQAKSGSVSGDFFRARPKPRVPDYLRESFDVADIDMRDDKAPISSSGIDVISIQTSEEKNKVLEEELPRAKPPSPYLKPANHPAQRSHEIDLFVPSSEGESDVSIPRKDGFRKKVSPQCVAPQKARIHTGARNGTPLLLPPSSFETQSYTKRHGNNGRHDKEPCGKQGLLLQTSSLPADSSGSSVGRTYHDKQHKTIPHEIPFVLTSGADLQAQIFDARNRLQDHYQLKIYYRSVKRRRDQLEMDLCTQHENTSDDDTTTRDNLAKLNKETKDLFAKIVRDRPLVEALATKVKQLIEKIQI